MSDRTVIVGAGPAGLTAALELGKLGKPGVVYEADDIVGGISRSVEFRGCRLDIGGHRFFTKVPEVEALWHEILGDDLLTRERMSRIYYRDAFFDYPLKPMNALRGLGIVESVRVVMSYLYAQLFPIADERAFDAWVSNRFGRRLFQIFFETYTEKVWGMPCSEISAAWAAQRIKNLDLFTAIKNAFLGERGKDGEVVTSLIEQFLYPRLGPGMMWERCSELAASHGIETHLNSRVVKVHHRDGKIVAAEIRSAAGDVRREDCTSLISSMPITALVRAMTPAAPEAVIEAADSLRYRDFLIIGLIVDREHLFPDNWIYIHSPDVRVGRVQSFKNWSPEMVADPEKSFIGLEYFVQEGDDLWTQSDEALVKLGAVEGDRLGLFDKDEVVAGTVVRMPKAYPVYDDEYENHLATLRDWLDGFENLYTIGRNGQHRYNNQDHSMVAGLYAARNVAGADLDLWSINVEQVYHEEVSEGEAGETSGQRSGGNAASGGDRLTPSRVQEQNLDEVVRDAFAHYDPVAAGGAIGITASLALAVATGILLLGSDSTFVPMLSLLGQFLFGFEVSVPGLIVGMIEVAIVGYLFGWTVTKLINRLLSALERDLERRLSALTMLDP